MNLKILKTGLIFLVLISLSACSDSSKPSVEVSEVQIQEDAISLAFIKAKFSKVESLVVISKPIQDNQCLVVADITYDNGEALISGKVVINYVWSKKVWKAVNIQFSYSSLSTKDEPQVQDVLDTATAIEAVENQFQASSFMNAPVLVSKELNLELGEATYVVTRASIVEGWKALTTYTIKAKYYYMEAWVFTIDSWAYTETTNWAGNWSIFWPSTATETQYDPDETMNINVAGELTITHNSEGNQEQVSNVNVSFNRLNSPYTLLPVVISTNYEDVGLYNSRFIIVKYGNENNDEFSLELSFITNDAGAKTIQYSAMSFDGTKGILTRIN